MKILLPIVFLFPLLAFSQAKKADSQTQDWRYEIEGVGTGVQGSYQVKVWSYSKDVATATEQCKKNAVHGIIFKGFPDKERVKGQRPLAGNSLNVEQEKKDFFDDFFKNGGKYLKYVTLANHGEIEPGDRIKISKNEYKIGLVVSVSVAQLRKDLEDAGIIKSLNYGF